MNTLTVTTWNIGSGPNAKKAEDLAAMALAAQVICCQEGGDRQPILRLWSGANGWNLFAGTTGGGPKVPILTNPDLRVLDARTVIAVGKYRVGVPGAGPTWLQRKAINHITLGLADGTELHVVNTHMVASVTRGRLPNVGLRRRHYKRHMAALCALIDSLDGPVVVTGDFNAEPDFDLLQPLLRRVQLVESGPTHGRRRIDFIGYRGLEPTGDVTTARNSSDHRPVTATFVLPGLVPVLTRGRRVDKAHRLLLEALSELDAAKARDGSLRDVRITDAANHAGAAVVALAGVEYLPPSSGA